MAFIAAFQQNRGIIKYACADAGIARQTYYNWIESDSRFKEACDIVLDEQIDFVEKKLMENIGLGMERSITFYLERKGRKRGYDKDDKESEDPFLGVKYTPREAERLAKLGMIVDPAEIQQYDNE